jgi:tetratricopeptide (TPR) repeat protein
LCLLDGARAPDPAWASSHAAASQTADAAALDEARRLTEESRQLRNSGKYDAALPLAERALALREKTLGPEHLEVANALHLVALILDDKHDYPKAEPPNLRALAIRESRHCSMSER